MFDLGSAVLNTDTCFKLTDGNDLVGSLPTELGLITTLRMVSLCKYSIWHPNDQAFCLFGCFFSCSFRRYQP